MTIRQRYQDYRTRHGVIISAMHAVEPLPLFAFCAAVGATYGVLLSWR